MNDRPTTTVLDPLPDLVTLDADRADLLAGLVAESLAGPEVVTIAAGRTVRRALVGSVAAATLAGGLLAANAIVGGPGPAAIDPAVAIEQADGWTTISILDPSATPAEIEAELEAAGIDASVSVEPLLGQITAPSGVHSTTALPLSLVTGGDDHRASYLVSSFDVAEPGGLRAIGVDFEVPDGSDLDLRSFTIDDGSEDGPRIDDEAAFAAFRGAMEEVGVRTGAPLADGSISIRDGADVDILLATSP